MAVSHIFVPKVVPNQFPPVPVLPVRVVGPTGPTGAFNGLTVTIVTAKVTPSGATGSIVFTNGLLTAQTQAT